MVIYGKLSLTCFNPRRLKTASFFIDENLFIFLTEFNSIQNYNIKLFELTVNITLFIAVPITQFNLKNCCCYFLIFIYN